MDGCAVGNWLYRACMVCKTLDSSTNADARPINTNLNCQVRSHAVAVLQQKDDDELMYYLLQLVQVSCSGWCGVLGPCRLLRWHGGH